MNPEQAPTKHIIINPDMTFTDNDLCFLLFGRSMDMVADEIVNDTSGKYDCLYETETK